MHYIANSWDAICKDTIANSFKCCGFRRDNDSSTGDTMIVDYVNANDNISVCDTAALDEITEDITLPHVDTFDEEDNSADADACVPAFLEASQSIDKILQFVCTHNDIIDLLP
ncbi:hypothetical protein HPB47_022453 [Ixodes persulcatus]|uniref:Uncharacterized protein n=1 Tax=Ixodes persulcatus TaxID=34615 RepID=A0AC60QAQ3_IXOPE|nr:hypothetical protein HPB47_022453 [Ixodes persulcatus]